MTPGGAILVLLAERRGSICPSEAARRLDPAGWRARMPEVHAAARMLAAAGRVRLTQGGRPAAEPRGAYRIFCQETTDAKACARSPTGDQPDRLSTAP